MVKTVRSLLSLTFLFLCLPGFSQKLEPSEKDALITVQVVNEKQKPQPGEQVFFESVTTKQVYSGITKEGGKFDMLVPKGDKYNIKYKTITSDAEYTVLEVPNVKGELLSFDVIIQFELPKRYTLDNVYFETGKADIKPASYKYIDEMAEYMKLKKTMVIEISGYTDNVGNPEANLKLSQDRSNSVRAYLLKKGIAENRVSAKGYGDTQPVASNDTDAGRQKNRRTEVRVIKE
jgi:OmpA-OmpF porin, OOP family